METVNMARCVNDLFAIITARLRDDDEAVALLIDDVVERRMQALVALAGVMTAGELLSRVAAARGMRAASLVCIMRDSHRMMAGHLTVEGSVLDATLRYTEAPMPQAAIDAVADLTTGGDPRPALLAAVRVAAGALAWHADDLGTDAVSAGAELCLALAGRAAR